MIIFLTCVRYHQSSTETSLTDLWLKQSEIVNGAKAAVEQKRGKPRPGDVENLTRFNPNLSVFLISLLRSHRALSCLNKTWREYSMKLSPFHVWWYCKNRITMWWQLVFFLKRELAFSPMNNMRSIIYFWNSCRNSSDLARSLVESHCQ